MFYGACLGGRGDLLGIFGRFKVNVFFFFSLTENTVSIFWADMKKDVSWRKYVSLPGNK